MLRYYYNRKKQDHQYFFTRIVQKEQHQRKEPDTDEAGDGELPKDNKHRQVNEEEYQHHGNIKNGDHP